MTQDIYKHINKELEPQTAAGTMALYLRDTMKEKISIGSGIVQIDDPKSPSELQLIFGNEFRYLTAFILSDGTIGQITVDQGLLAPTTIFLPPKENPELITEDFLYALLYSLFPEGEKS
jgi:hypothetical protein